MQCALFAKINVEELIRTAISRLTNAGTPIHIVDIAAGHGRYVLDALINGTSIPDSILLRDYSDINVRDGAALIREKKVEALARFEKADAFDRDSLAAISPRPTIAIVVVLACIFARNGGLYLFSWPANDVSKNERAPG